MCACPPLLLSPALAACGAAPRTSHDAKHLRDSLLDAAAPAAARVQRLGDGLGPGLRRVAVDCHPWLQRGFEFEVAQARKRLQVAAENGGHVQGAGAEGGNGRVGEDDWTKGSGEARCRQRAGREQAMGRARPEQIATPVRGAGPVAGVRSDEREERSAHEAGHPQRGSEPTDVNIVPRMDCDAAVLIFDPCTRDSASEDSAAVCADCSAERGVSAPSASLCLLSRWSRE